MLKSVPIPRIERISPEDFKNQFYVPARPVVITDGPAHQWAAYRNWTPATLRDRVGDVEVEVRAHVSSPEYRCGLAYELQRITYSKYVDRLLAGGPKAKEYYMAVQNIKKVFPTLIDDVSPVLPELIGKIHRGPFLWHGPAGHFEFTHQDPDDNFLFILSGEKRVRLFHHRYHANLYPNPLGSEGFTIQWQKSSVDLDSWDPETHPLLKDVICEEATLRRGDMLWLPAFYWHQVTTTENSLSINVFFGDAGEHAYIDKLFKAPYASSFEFWIKNIVEQNRHKLSFPVVLAQLPHALHNLLFKNFHDMMPSDTLNLLVSIVLSHLNLESLPSIPQGRKALRHPQLSVRGLRRRSAAPYRPVARRGMDVASWAAVWDHCVKRGAHVSKLECGKVIITSIGSEELHTMRFLCASREKSEILRHNTTTLLHDKANFWIWKNSDPISTTSFENFVADALILRARKCGSVGHVLSPLWIDNGFLSPLLESWDEVFKFISLRDGLPSLLKLNCDGGMLARIVVIQSSENEFEWVAESTTGNCFAGLFNQS